MASILRRPTLVALVAGAAWVVGGCLSPTLPLPNEGLAGVTETEPGVYRLTGNVTPNARVFAWNRNSDLIWGQQTEADGAFDFLVQGEPGDFIQFYYVLGTDQSDDQAFELP